MREPDHSPTAAAARAALAELPGRSPLLAWMRENHALITERLDEVRPRWNDIARAIGSLGVRDANGEPPKVEAVRRAYHRVAGALDAKGRRRRRPKGVSAPGTGPSTAFPAPSPAPAPAGPPRNGAFVPAMPSAPAFDPTEGAFDPRPTTRFKPASLK